MPFSANRKGGSLIENHHPPMDSIVAGPNMIKKCKTACPLKNHRRKHRE